MAAASRGEMPKKAASNKSTPLRNPPCCVYIEPGVSASALKYARQSHRSRGISVMASRPSASRFQKEAASVAPPGNLSPAPMMAIDVCCDDSNSSTRVRSARISCSARLTGESSEAAASELCWGSGIRFFPSGAIEFLNQQQFRLFIRHGLQLICARDGRLQPCDTWRGCDR